MIIFSFAGKHRIVLDQVGRTFNVDDSVVGTYTYYDEEYVRGTILDDEHRAARQQELKLAPLKQLAKDEVMRLYEEQVYGVENKPSDLVIEEWKQKEVIAQVYLDPATAPGDKLRAELALNAAVTTKETLLFAAEDPPLIVGTDTEDIAERIAKDILRAAWDKRTLLAFAGRERRNANDLIDQATDYLDLAEKVLFIQTEVPARTAQFLAQFANP